MSRQANNNDNNHILTLDERAFYIRMSIEGTQRIIEECLTRYEKDGDMFALKLALDGNVQLAEMLKMINKLSCYGHDFELTK